MPVFVNSPQTEKIEKIAKKFVPGPPSTLINNPYNWKYGQTPYAVGLCNLQYTKPEFKLPVPGEGLPRIINYCADQSGCAFWRMIWPAHELLGNNKAVVMTLYQMVQFAPFYAGIDAIRLQRQCSDHQKEFIKWLRQVSDELKKQTGKGFRLIYEIDDICAPKEHIPHYNACRSGFQDDNILKNLIEILSYCDEMTVPSPYMKEHYTKYTGFDKISVIPNYLPRGIIDEGFDLDRIMDNYDENQHKPRIVYAGSSTHFDILNSTGQRDDFFDVVDHIIADITGPQKYQWVFLGGHPLKLLPHIQSKQIEYHQWGSITDYMTLLKNLKGNIMIAPLADNTFNRAKANIKLTEGGTVGMPVVAQNLDCYNRMDKHPHLFDTPAEMFNHIDTLMVDRNVFEKAVKDGKALSESYHLNNHLDEWLLMFKSEYGSFERKNNESFVKNNPDQFK